MKLLGGNADLRPQTELAAVCEPGGGVDVHRRRIHVVQEVLGLEVVLRDDGLGVLGAVGIDEIDGLIHAACRLDSQDVVIVLGVPVAVFCRYRPGARISRASGSARSSTPFSSRRGRAFFPEVRRPRPGGPARTPRRAHRGTGALGIEEDAGTHVQVCLIVDIDVAHALAGADHWYAGLLGHGPDQPGATPGISTST